MKIKNIEIDLRDWDERCPSYMTIDSREEYVDSAKDIIDVLVDATSRSYLTAETEIVIKYHTDSQIPMTMTCNFNMQTILYFRNKPKYGIDFLPSEKMTEEERRELVNNIFSNADEFLREEIYEVIKYLVNSKVMI